MVEFMNGITVALCAVAGLIFLKFWFGARDRLFLMFAVAFWILAIDRTALTILPYFIARTTERDTVIYLVRLLAFIVLLIAIIDKNRRSPGHRTPTVE